jgi:hypothetical protein
MSDDPEESPEDVKVSLEKTWWRYVVECKGY